MNEGAAVFAYDEQLAEQYPTLRAGLLHASGLTNRPSPPQLLAAYHAEQQAAAQRLRTTPAAEMPSIAAWRRVFTRFGATPTKHRSAPEALLRRLSSHDHVPSIGTLVDIGNLVSLRYAVPVAVFDLARIRGTLTVRFATGAEQFTDLGSTASTKPGPGEVVFVDEDEVVMARRWCWRQSAEAATGPDTTAALFVVEAHHETAASDVNAALDDLTDLLATHQPGHVTARGTLSPSDQVRQWP